MTWDLHRGRWRKVFEGKVYYFAPAGNKENTYQAANAWWRQKRSELEASKPQHPHFERLAELERRLEWSERHGTPQTPIRAELEITRSLTEHDDPPPLDYPTDAYLNLLPMVGIRVDDDADPEAVARIIGNRRIHEDRARRDNIEPVPKDKTIGGLTDKYISIERVRYESGQIKIGTWHQERGCLFHFRDWLGASKDVAIINADQYEAYWARLNSILDKGDVRSIDSKKRHLRIAKQFIVWLSEKGLIPLPSNLASRRYRFKVDEKPIATMTIEQVQTLIGNATGQLELHLLLMLNCGFTQIDITDLRQGEIDWSKGRITRKRSKATNGGYGRAPIVSWKLWDKTTRLLKQYQSSGDRVLLTGSGTAWTTRSGKGDDGFSKTDNIVSAFRRLLEKLSKSHPGKEFGSLTELRATASTMLDDHPTYGRYAQHFLGQTPRSVAASHYITPSQTQFDNAVKWLGKQYGF